MTAPRPRSRLPLIAIFVITLAPVVFSLLAYYVPSLGLRPASRTQYGTLVEPQRPIPAQLALQDTQGKPFDLETLKGRWLLLSAGPSACPESCVRGLFVLRNAHASQGKNVDRLERIWFVTDDGPIPSFVKEAYVGTRVLRASPEALSRWLVPDHPNGGTQALQDGLWIVDPLGHLMMRFPDTQQPEAVRDDIRVLLKNSRIG